MVAVCVAGGVCGGGVWQGGVHRGRHAWRGGVAGGGMCGRAVCIARDIDDRGVHSGGEGMHGWQERWSLQQTIRIILGCIPLS